MSTTVYQTMAKPRGRKDIDQLDNDGANSRASSQASQKLAKTVSRNLEDVSSPIKARSGSPAFFWHRNKAVDAPMERDSSSTPTQPAPNDDNLRQNRPLSSSFVASQLNTHEISIPGAFPASSQDNPHFNMAPSNNLSRVASQGQTKPRRSISVSRRRSLTQSSIARMQPSVADASDDETARILATARSSATSLDLKSVHGSDLGSKTAENFADSPAPPVPSNPPPNPPVNDQYKPAKNDTVHNTPNASRRPSLRSTAGFAFAPTSQHLFQATPSSYRTSSPRQYPADTTHQLQQSTALPAISPPHSPTLMHQPVFSGLPARSYPYGYPPQIGPGQMVGPSYPASLQHMPSPPLTGSFSENLGPGSGDSQQDWAKLTSVLPELNRLLSKYEGQKGQTPSKESFASQLDHHRTHEVASLRVELEANKSEYEKVIQKLVTETFDLKREIESRDKSFKNMQLIVDELQSDKQKHTVAQSKQQDVVVQHQTLQENHALMASKFQQANAELQELRKSHEALQKKHQEADNEVSFYRNEATSWKQQHEESTTKRDQMKLALEESRASRTRLETNMDEMRRKNQTRDEKHQIELKNLRGEYETLLDSKDKERDSLSSEHKIAIGAVHLELAGIIDRHGRQKRDLESARAHVSSLEKKLDAKSKDREEQSARHRHQIETKLKEMEEQAGSHRRQLEAQLGSLTTQREKELDAMQHDHDKEVHHLRKEHDKKLARLGDNHVAELKKVQSEVNEQKSLRDAHRRETEDLRTRHSELAGVMVSWKQRHEEWQAEQNKLSKIMEALHMGPQKEKER